MVDISVFGLSCPDWLIDAARVIGATYQLNPLPEALSAIGVVVDPGDGSMMPALTTWVNTHPLRPVWYQLGSRSTAFAVAAFQSGAWRVDVGGVSPILLRQFLLNYQLGWAPCLQSHLRGPSVQWALDYLTSHWTSGHPVSANVMAGFRSARWNWQSVGPDPIRILVVDDEPALREVFDLVLGDQGYQITFAENGTTACEYLRSMPPFDLMVCDVGLPDIRGEKVADQCRNLAPETEVIMASAFADSEGISACFSAGATDYIIKPFMNNQLLRAVSQGLVRRALRSIATPVNTPARNPSEVMQTVVRFRSARGLPVYYHEVRDVFGLALRSTVEPESVIPDTVLNLSSSELLSHFVDR